MNQAEQLWQADKHQAAIQTLTQMITKSPDSRQLYLQLADYLTLVKDFPQAADFITKSLVRFPADTDLTFALGTVAYQSGDYNQAIQIFQPLLKTNQGNDAQYMLGVSYFRMEDYVHALAFAITAQQNQPTAVDANVLVGDCFAAIGDQNHALTYYQNACDQSDATAQAYFRMGITQLTLGQKPDQAFLQAKKLDAAYFAAQQQQITEIQRFIQATGKGESDND